MPLWKAVNAAEKSDGRFLYVVVNGEERNNKNDRIITLVNFDVENLNVHLTRQLL